MKKFINTLAQSESQCQNEQMPPQNSYSVHEYSLSALLSEFFPLVQNASNLKQTRLQWLVICKIFEKFLFYS